MSCQGFFTVPPSFRISRRPGPGWAQPFPAYLLQNMQLGSNSALKQGRIWRPLPWECEKSSSTDCCTKGTAWQVELTPEGRQQSYEAGLAPSAQVEECLGRKQAQRLHSAWIRAHIVTFIRTYIIHPYMPACIDTCILHTYLRTHAYTCTLSAHTPIHIHIHIYIYTCTYTYMQVHVHVHLMPCIYDDSIHQSTNQTNKQTSNPQAFTHMQSSVRSTTYTYMYIYIYIYIYKYRDGIMYACMCIYSLYIHIQTYMYVYIGMYMCVYAHT